jgi:hypothetical protein
MAEHIVPVDDPLAVHVWHCSPCFAEFKIFRDRKRARDRRIVRVKLCAGAVALCAGVVLTTFLPGTSKVGELDFSRQASERSVSTVADHPRKLRAAAEVLLLVLPTGSDTGDYELEIRSGSDIAKAIKAVQGRASKDADGRIKLRCDLGRPFLHSGPYIAAWRFKGTQSWHYGTFIAN